MTILTAIPRSTVSLSVAEEVIAHQFSLLAAGKIDPLDIAPVMLWGPPGIGKSALLRTFCADRGIGFVDVRLAQRDPVDMRGLPVPDGDVVRWLLPSEWPREADSRGIILFDELTAADRTLQVAAYEFILDRRLGDLYRVPDGWLLCGAGNRSEDSAVAMPFSSALANRFLHLDLAAHLPDWCRWALGAGVAPELVAFLRFRPALLFDMGRADLERGWPSPRSWARVSTILRTGGQLSRQALRAAIEGLVGPGATIELLAYLEIMVHLPDLKAVLRGEVELTVPTQADRLFAIATGLARLLWLQRDPPRSIGIFLSVGRKMPADFAALSLTDALDGATFAQRRAVIDHHEFTKWRAVHGDDLVDARPDMANAVIDGPDHAHTRVVADRNAVRKLLDSLGDHPTS